jgi:hypothetical protein
MDPHPDAIPKGVLWRLARTMLILVALMYALKLIGRQLSFDDTAYGLGALVFFFLATLTDRTDFYNFGPQPPDPGSRSN